MRNSLVFLALSCAGGALAADPAGAREFDVVRPAADGIVARAADYGVRPDVPDNTPALNRALGICRTNGTRRLVFGKGTYRFTSDDSIHLAKMENFVFDGAGADFVFYRKKAQNFFVSECRQLEFRDFSVDWDWEKDPLASLVEVLEATSDHVDFKFVHYETFPRRDLRVAYTSPWDPVQRAV